LNNDSIRGGGIRFEEYLDAFLRGLLSKFLKKRVITQQIGSIFFREIRNTDKVHCPGNMCSRIVVELQASDIGKM
jgi:hypothetical protein